MLKVGQNVFVTCEVKPGPFSDERMIKVDTSSGPWVGFVHVSRLKEPILEGTTSVVAVVVAVSGSSFTAQIPGHSVQSSVIQGSEDGLIASGTL